MLKIQILNIFNYNEKMKTFLYAHKTGQKEMKTYTVYFYFKL